MLKLPMPENITRNSENKIQNPISGLDKMVRFADMNPSLISTEEINEFITKAKQESSQFREKFENSLENKLYKNDPELNQWFENPENNQLISKFTKDAIILVEKMSASGLPGHDRRHVACDVISDLNCLQEESITDFNQAAMIGALYHDVGRWSEIKLWGQQLGGVLGVDHPKISFMFIKEIFKKYPDVPQKLQDQVLYSILVHQEGGGQGNFFAEFVQRGDREQLVGSEGIARFFAFDCGLDDRSIKTKVNNERRLVLPLPGKPEDTDLMHHIEFYMRNLYPLTGNNGPQKAKELKIISGTFLYLSSTDEIRDQIFYPEIYRDQNNGSLPEGLKFKTPISEEIWQQIKKGPSEDIRQHIEEIKKNNSNYSLISRIISSKGFSVVSRELENIEKNINEFKDNTPESDRLKDGLAYEVVMMLNQENNYRQTLNKIKETYPQDSIPSQMASLASRIIL